MVTKFGSCSVLVSDHGLGTRLAKPGFQNLAVVSKKPGTKSEGDVAVKI